MFKYILIILLILQIVLFFVAVIKRGRPRWELLLKIQILSVIYIVVYFVIFNIFNKYSNWDSLGVLFRVVFYGIIYTISLIISLVIRSKNQVETIENNIKKMQFILIVGSIILLLFSIVTDIKPYIKEKNDREEISKVVIDYLNTKYGNNGYKVINIRDNEVCIFTCGPSTYTFEMMSNYLNNSFSIEVDKYKKSIESDDFMYEYTRQNKWCSKQTDNNQSECLLDSFYNDDKSFFYTSEIYTINIDLLYEQNYINIKYGKLPEIDDIKRNMNLKYNKFTINKDFATELELRNFMVDFYNNYLKGYPYKDTRIVNFTFKYDNPFSDDNEAFKKAGYLKEYNNNIYIYYKSNPIVISKTLIN